MSCVVRLKLRIEMCSAVKHHKKLNLSQAEATTDNVCLLFRLAQGLIPNIPDKKSESSAEPSDIILR